MAHEFIGKNVLVTLKNPAGRAVQGVVAQVITDAVLPQLVLKNGKPLQ